MSKANTYLQNKLRKKMLDAGISAHALEKQAGLKRSAVQNILYGKSRKPSGEILGAITKVLNCSINELLGQDNSHVESREILPPSPSNTESFDIVLYGKAVNIANEILQDFVTLNKLDALNYINEIYAFSLNANLQEIDRNFAEWLAKKLLVNRG